MKTKLLFLILLFAAFNVKVTAQNFAWAKRMGGVGYEQAISVVVDAAGNVYTTGFFAGTSDFDPGVGIYNLTSAGNWDIFISKLDASGNFVWAKRIGGVNNDEGNSIGIDAFGNVYTTGYFEGTSDFDPGVGIYNLTSAGNLDIFVSKLDASGNFVWAKRIGGVNNDEGNSIAVDAIGNVYTTGYFESTSDFDPGVGVYNLTLAGSNDIFVSKLDSSGNFVWAKRMGGTSGETGNSIVLDASGNVYTTGYFQFTSDFDPGVGVYNLTSEGAGSDDIFISKLDTSGNFVWAKCMGGVYSDQATSIAVDASGNVYTTGRFWGSADFDPGAGTFNFNSSGNWDIFISKLDVSGNFVWAKRMGGINFDYGSSIALDSSGNVYTTGYFGGTADFNPGPGMAYLTSAGNNDIFISKLDASGNFVWAKSMGGTGYEQANSMAVDGTGNVYTTGYFGGTADFDPGVGIVNLTSAGNYDIFVSKLSCSSVTTDIQTACDSLTWIDNVTYTSSTNTPTFTLTNAAGCDSVVTLNLTILNSTTGVDTQIACDSLTWINNVTYTLSTTIPTVTLINTAGCDSVVTLNLTILNSTTGVDTQVSCDSLTWIDNITYTSTTNTPTFTLTNVAGCDSVVTLNLSIKNTSSSSDVVTACDSIVWIDGNTYSASTNVPIFNIVGGAVNGCDSVVNLNLTILNSTGIDTQIACDSLTWIDNVTYITSTTTPTVTLTNINGCDSVVTLNLTISNLNASYTSIDNGGGNYTFTNTSIGSFTQTHWAFGDGTTSTLANPTHTFSANGTYVVVLTINDSTTNNTCMDYYLDTLVVTGVVNPVPCAAGFVMYPDGNNNVTVVNSSTGNNLTYFWDFGDGDTSTMQFPSHTYATVGPFYICLTVNDGTSCVDTYCDSIGINGVLFNKQTGFTINVIAPPVVVGVDEQGALVADVTIYPNPATNEFVVELTNFSPSTQINIISIEGKTVYINNTINTNKINVDAADWSKGVYIVKITSRQSSKVMKLIKQ